MLRKKCRPIPLEEFPTDKKTTDYTNCLAFVLGIKKPRKKDNQYSLIPTKEEIGEIFLKKVRELGFNPKQFRKITREEERIVGGYIIRVYGFAAVETLEDGIRYDFHLIRREPDGRWVHKPGYFYHPKAINQEYWIAICERFGNDFVSFALEA